MNTDHACSLDAHGPFGSHWEDLLAQIGRLAARGEAIPDRLIVACADDTDGFAAGRLGPALRLRSQGLCITEELRATLLRASAELHVSTVLVLANTRCEHLPAAEPVAGRDAFLRIVAGAQRTQRRIAAMRERLRREVKALHAAIAPRERATAVYGVAHLVEAGTVHVYRPVEDSFVLAEDLVAPEPTQSPGLSA